MTERTLDTAVKELYASGLSVEQQILVAEIYSLAVSKREKREGWRAAKRVQRCPEMSEDKRKEPKENNILNKSPRGVFKGGVSEDTFEIAYQLYPKKVAKAKAKRAYGNALKRATAEQILEGVKRYAASCRGKDPEFIAHFASWLNADRWLDEDTKQASTVTRGPWKPFEPEPEVEKPSEAERKAQVERLLKRTSTNRFDEGLTP